MKPQKTFGTLALSGSTKVLEARERNMPTPNACNSQRVARTHVELAKSAHQIANFSQMMID